MPASRLIVPVLALALLLAGCSGSPTGKLELAGDLAAHDPAIVVDGDDWYVFATGSARGDGNIQIRRSTDQGHTWTFVDTVWNEKPEWLVEAVPGVANLWAPELIEHDGTWYLYYAASTFGSNHSVIALATNATLDPDDPAYEWVDQGRVLESQTSDDFNAIDAGVIDVDGTPWMAFGSFWSGIRMVELEWPTGMLADPDAEPLRLADRGSPPNAIEAPYVVGHDGWFYLFVSKDSCCQGLNSTYSMWVGRSEEVTGPYVDRDGVPMLEDGGTLLLKKDGDEIGPGGQSVSNGWLAYHFYDGANGGDPTLAIRSLTWDAEGWPVLGQ